MFFGGGLFILLSLIFHAEGSETEDNSGLRIYGGTPTNISDFPYAVSFQNDVGLRCGGVILNRSIVLTAAHCVEKITEDWIVVAGRTKYNEKTKLEQIATIQSFHSHPKYTASPIRNDIGIVILNEELEWTVSVQPARLPMDSSSSYGKGDILTVVGWGEFEEQAISKTLLKVLIHVRDPDNCSTKFTRNFVPDTMICAGGEGQDSCRGDSGGPLVDSDGGLAGIVSFGRLVCGPSAGVYTRVSLYLDWIKAIIHKWEKLNEPRTATKILSVENATPWGSWGSWSFCKNNEFATGFQMKVEPNQGKGDDTSVNSVRLNCASNTNEGQWGSFTGMFQCPENRMITRFKLQVEPSCGSCDDTSVNNVAVSCRGRGFSNDLDINGNYSDSQQWGEYGSWSESCDSGSAVCGIRIRVEAPQGDGDDTALNDVELACCAW